MSGVPLAAGAAAARVATGAAAARASLAAVRGGGEPGPDRPLVLLLHGYGSSEHDLAALGPLLPDDVAWAAVRAPLALGGGAHAWFPIGVPGSPDPAPVEAATAALRAWVEHEVDAAVPVVPLGFSQGGLMATQLLRAEPERYSAAVVLAGFVLAGSVPGDAVLAERRPPVLWVRGDADRVIAADAVARTEAWLPGHSTLRRVVHPGLGHGVSPAVVDDVVGFLADHRPAGAHAGV